MRKLAELEVTFCDQCGKQEYVHACLGCGKEFCYDCRKVFTVEYKHSITFAGSGDGEYCRACDRRLSAEGDPLHAAYVQIANLRAEAEAFYEDYRIRGKRAEARLKAIQEKRGG